MNYTPLKVYRQTCDPYRHLLWYLKYLGRIPSSNCMIEYSRYLDFRILRAHIVGDLKVAKIVDSRELLSAVNRQPRWPPRRLVELFYAPKIKIWTAIHTFEHPKSVSLRNSFNKNVSGTPWRHKKFVIKVIDRPVIYTIRWFVLVWSAVSTFWQKLVWNRREF